MNQESIRQYSYKNIFEDTLNLIAQQEQLVLQPISVGYDASKYSISFCGRTIEITILQLQMHMILVLSEKENVPLAIRFLATAYLNDQVSNTYKNLGTLGSIAPLFRSPKGFQFCQDVLKLRLKDFIEGKTQTSTHVTNYNVLVFLDSKSLLSLFSANHQVHQIQKGEEFWFRLFNFKFGRTGFTAKDLNWKVIYLTHNNNPKSRKWVRIMA